MKKLCMISFMLLIVTLLNAQISGIKNIPGDYATIQAAINTLNSIGVGAGGVTFVVALNHTETLANATAGVLTATGTVTDSIIFKKASGTGANPKITAFTPGTTTTDGMIKITGGDYIVFNGIDLAENAANNNNTKRMDWGYALIKKQSTTPFNGCQSVVIKNCTITLNKANTNSVGIYSGNHIATATTPLSITDTSDACNNCKFFSNTITNVYSGIKLNGYAAAAAPFTLYDQNNEIGVGGGNKITNYGGSSTACYGIFGAYQNQLKIFNNSVTGGNSSGFTQCCISFSTSSAASGEIAWNTVSAPGTSTTGEVYGIHCDAGEDGTSNTISIHDNTVMNCTTSSNINNIYYNSNANNVNIFNNTIYGSTVTGALVQQGIYVLPGTIIGSLNIYNNDIYNLTISGAGKFYGIVAGGYTSTNIYANSVYNCSSNGNSVYGISSGESGTCNWNVYKNEIYNLASNNGATANSFVYGIYFQGGSGAGVTIYNNFVSDLRATTSIANPAICGINLSTGSTYDLSYNTVFLNTSGTSASFSTIAIRVGTGATTTLRNNILMNVSTPGTTGNTICYQRVGGTGSGLATYSPSSNNNNFYAGTPGPKNLIYTGGITGNCTTIEAFKVLASPRDSQSFSENTPFQNKTTAPYDLHVSATVPTFCESGGITITTPNITSDIDGQPRYPNPGYPDHITYHATAPDVGADEFGGIHNDTTPPLISYVPLLKTSSLAPRTLLAEISDLQSGVPTAAPGAPVLYWKINNAATWNSSTGSFVSGNQYSFTFGNGVVPADVVYYYICAQDGFLTPNVAVSPATGADGLSTNPPACSIPPSLPNAYRIVGTLPAGNYLIGGTGNLPAPGCTYVDITQAFGDVNDVIDRIEVTNGGTGYEPWSTTVSLSGGGGSGASAVAFVDESGVITAIEVTNNGNGYYNAPNVTIESGTGSGATANAVISPGKVLTGPVNFILDVSYASTEENAYPLHLENVVGSSSSNTITLKPGPLSSPVIETYSGASIFKINGADYFTLDGSKNGSSTQDLTLSYLPSAINSAVVWIASASEVDGATHNTIKNCVMHGSGSRTYTYAVIFSGGTGLIEYNSFALAPNSYNTIENNTIYWARNGIIAFGKSAFEPDEGLMLKNNQVGTSNDDEGFTYQGIYLENQSTGSITGNHIQNIIYNDLYHAIAGIYLSNSKGMTISANMIHNIKQLHDGVPWFADGIYQIAPAFNNQGNPSENIYSNNVIYDLTSNGEGSYYNVIGLHNAMGWGDQYYYNSVYLSGQLNAPGSPGGNMSACFSNGMGVNSTYTSNIEVKNNVFYMNSNNTSGVNHHYAHYANLNSYSGSRLEYNLLFYAVTGTAIGHIGYFNSSNLDNIELWREATFQDYTSLSVDPLFTSATNLAPQAGSPLLGAGVQVSGISTDFTGAPRNVMHPSIGAYENALVISGKSWNGSVSSDWYDDSNWTPSGVPTAADDLTITPGTNFNCIVNILGAVCNNISISFGATLTLQTGSGLTVYGNFTIQTGGALTNDGRLDLKGNLVNQN